VQPLIDNKITTEDELAKAQGPIREFMLKQTRRDDLGLFLKLAGGKTYDSAEDVPFPVLVPAFVTSELKTGFQIGFLIFLPFLVIDIVVAAVMMSLGMMLLSPTSVSLPLKLALFVLVNGWTLVRAAARDAVFAGGGDGEPGDRAVPGGYPHERPHLELCATIFCGAAGRGSRDVVGRSAHDALS
jgi:hypothetical protein